MRAGDQSKSDSSGQIALNPILRFGPAFFPECSAFAFFTFAIPLASISCVTCHFTGSASALPPWIAFTHFAHPDARTTNRALTMSADSAHSCMKRRLPVYLPIRANTTLQPKKHFLSDQ